MSTRTVCQRCLALSATVSRAKPQSHGSIQRWFSSSSAKQPVPTQDAGSRVARRRRISTLGRQQQQQGATVQLSREYPTASTQQSPSPYEDNSRLLLKPNNLFHSFTNSPSPEIRRRAAFMKQNAYCPHPDHQRTRQPESQHDMESRKVGSQPPAHVRYECPDCGIPVSCSEEHFVDDYEAHLEICDVLREINEDDHDLRSGRFFPEFEYPGPQMDEAQVNMTNWDTLMYSREFNAINEDRSMRQATRLLTYPTTIASVLHELSPYDIKRGGRLTVEGLKSFSGMSSIIICSSFADRFSSPLHASPA